jgi:predicted alpha/beta-fold hydrolase
MARKFYEGGRKVVRVNLRGCGSGAGLSKKPYCAGSSGDVRKVLQDLKLEAPRSEIVLIGFSLGGNIALKLAGEMGSDAEKWVKRFIAVSAPLDLFQSVKKIQENPIYHFYYLNRIKSQAKRWNPHKIRSLYEFDDQITAPLSGYGCAREYYQECSSIRFLPNIRQSARLLFAEDDPFISLDPIRDVLLPEEVEVAVTKRGGHMGFLGSGFKEKSLYWMDEQLLLWSQ